MFTANILMNKSQKQGMVLFYVVTAIYIIEKHVYLCYICLPIQKGPTTTANKRLSIQLKFSKFVVFRFQDILLLLL